MHSCLKCTSVCTEHRLHQADAGDARLPAGSSVQAPGSLNENKQAQPLLDKHKQGDTKTVKCLELATEFKFNTAGHMTAAGVSGRGRDETGGRGYGGLAMPSVLPDFGTKVKNGHEERMRDY